jgi:Darcynin, domain of unknown function
MTTATLPRTYTIFMLVKTTNDWLALLPAERFAFLDTDINPILQVHPTVKMRFFDAEGFNSRVTDVVVWETADLGQYSAVVERLRESRFWGRYFDVVEIIPGVENAYAEHYQVAAYGSGELAA